MTTFTQYYNKVAALDIQKIAGDSITDNLDLMTKLNQDQLQKGEAPDGGKIGQYRFKGGMYARIKNQMNPLPGLGNVDLILTKSFVSLFKSMFSFPSIITDSTDIKTDSLINRYGSKNIFGLAPDSKTTFITALRNSFLTGIRTAMK